MTLERQVPDATPTPQEAVSSPASLLATMSARRQALTHFGARAVADAVGRRPSPTAISAAGRHARLTAGLDWLARAQDQGCDRGSSYGYTASGGWQPSCIDTTSAVVSTFLRASEVLDRSDLRERAVEAGRWLCSIQLEDGNIPGSGPPLGAGTVFTTGQSLRALVHLARAHGGDEFVTAGRRAAEWLVAAADDDGLWSAALLDDTPPVLNASIAWSLVCAARSLDLAPAAEVAEANLRWICDQQRPNGWFRHAASSPGLPASTRHLALAGQALFDAGAVFDDERCRTTARRLAGAAARHQRRDGTLPGAIAIHDRPAGRASCLTANADFVSLWLRLDAQAHDHQLGHRARQAIAVLATHQTVDGPAAIQGAVKGAHPIWGPHTPLGYPGHATRAYVDALLLLDAGSAMSPPTS